MADARIKRPDLEVPTADAVTVAYVHATEVAHSWHRSMMELVGWDWGHQARLLRGGWLAMRCGADGLVTARNKTVETFLAERTAEWLWWVDTDMGFAPDTVDRLLEVADPEKRPIVGGLCFAQRERHLDGMGGYRCSAAPTIYDWVQRPDGVHGFLGRATYPVNTVVKAAGTGSACILIHRSVFERIHEAHGAHWYDRVHNPESDQLIGEDLSFCLRAGALDIPVYVHTGVRTTHYKQFWLAEEDYWTRAVAPPAREQVDVLVPVMRRPKNAAPFMESLRASTGLATVYAIVGPDDDETERAWKDAGAQIRHASGTTFACKVNHGYRNSCAPWVFLVGDDVRFAPGWLDHAQAIADDNDNGRHYSVVGTNDMGNPRVTSGEHATHLLIRRSYIEEMGSSWDGPGVVAHEGYRHWFVDDEIVTAARQRGVWAMAMGSLVEHLHPMWGKGETDEVYELGAAHAEDDRATFEARCEANL